MDTAHWSQDIVVKPMEEIVTNSLPKPSNSLERKVRPQKEQALNCPRCNSTNTKFCYYNNYNLSQPRYFCKTCRRYWTEGGSLRNIPVGGGSRKNKRSSSSSNPQPKKIHDNNNLMIPQQNPNQKAQENHQDLNLGFSSAIPHDFKTINELIQVPNFVDKELQNPSSSSHHHNGISALELLNGFSTSRGLSLSSFMPNTTDYSSSGFSDLVPGFIKPSLNFSLDGLGSNYGSFQGVQETSGKLLFPFQDLKQVSNDNNNNNNNNNSNDAEENRDQNEDSKGYWNGVIGGGSW